MVPGGNHGARILELPDAERDAALATLSAWMGVELTVPQMKPGERHEPDPLDDHPRRAR